MINKLKKSAFLAFASVMSFQAHSQFYCDSNPVDVHGDLSVSGNRIVDQNNAAVSFAGNSMFWSNTTFGAERFYNANVVSWLKQDWGTTIVRAAMGVELFGGYLSDPEANKQRVRTVVDAAIAEGLYVIIDWHSHEAENYRQQAIDFFKEMATIYGDHPNVIYEIYNEPIHVSWSNDVKPYAEAVISEIRAIDPDNLIIVGSPTWSQDVDIASADPITSSINIAYTLHFYAATHRGGLRSKAQTALNNGVALMVTEWGTVSADGDGSVDAQSTNDWMAFLENNQISHLNWSVHDKVEGASILQPGASSNGNWSNSNLTSSGLFVKNIVENWEQFCDDSQVTNPTTPTEPEYVSIPARIQAEDYSSQSGTQVENTTDNNGGENVGYIDAGDFLTYNINVPNSGEHTIDFRLASRIAGTSFDIYQGNSIIGNVSSNATGGWQVWETVSETVSLNQGNQTIRLVATGRGWNINWLEFIEDDEVTTPTTPVTPNPTSGCDGISAWNPNTVYGEMGTQVVFDGNIYENKWYTVNQSPADFSLNSWDLWTFLGSCSSGKNLEANNLLDITVAPNPFVDSIMVNENDSNLKISTLQLVDLSGKIIYQQNVSSTNGLLNGLSGIAKGMYLVQVLNSKGTVIAVEKVIKE